jgi:hypothetical protein
MFYEELLSIPGGTISVPLPSNIPNKTIAPSFTFENLELKRQTTKLYKCSADAILSWDWKSGGCLYSSDNCEYLDFGDYWKEPPLIEELDPKRSVLKGNTLLMVQFKGRKNYAHFVLECLPKLFYFKSTSVLKTLINI